MSLLRAREARAWREGGEGQDTAVQQAPCRRHSVQDQPRCVKQRCGRVFKGCEEFQVAAQDRTACGRVSRPARVNLTAMKPCPRWSPPSRRHLVDPRPG